MGYYNNLRSEMLDFVPLSSKKILDVGCGEGLFGEQLIKERNAEVWGVEPVKEAAEKATKRLTKVINSFFDENIVLPKNYFDCIIFNDVLEHMLDPWKALNICKSLLDHNSSDPVIVASISNFRAWNNVLEIVLHAEWDYKNEGTLDKTHLRFFTFKSINKLFEDLGYEIILIKGINPNLSKKYRLLNSLLFNRIWDMRFLQFAVVAKIRL